MSDVTDLQIQLAEAQAAIYVPGSWRCAKCGFALTKSILYAKSGGIAPDLGQAEPCPNDGEPMQRETWKGDAIRLADRCCEMMQRERALSEKFAARAKHCRHMERRAQQFQASSIGARTEARYWAGRAEAWEVASINLTQSDKTV